jgi:hypothetical protein
MMIWSGMVGDLLHFTMKFDFLVEHLTNKSNDKWL